MKFFTTLFFALLVGALLLFLILGPKEFSFNALGWQAETRNVVRGVGSSGVQFEKLSAEIREAEQQIYELEAAGRMAAGDANAMSRQAEELEAEVARLREQVEIGKQLLREGRDEYVVGGRTLSARELVELVNYKADEFSRRARQLDDVKANAEAHQEMSTQLAQESRNLEGMIEAERMALVELKREYQLARIGHDMATIVSEVNLADDAFASGPYAQTKRGLQEEVYRMQSQADRQLRQSDISLSNDIDLRDPSNPEDLDSILEDIDRKVGEASARSDVASGVQANAAMVLEQQ